MKKFKITHFNYEKLLEIINNYSLKREESKKFKGLASYEKPWEKGNIFILKNVHIPSNISYIELIFNRSKFNACKETISCIDVAISDDDLKQKVMECAAALKKMGVKKGDVVCLCMAEVIEAAIIEGALNYIGAVSANIPSNSSPMGIMNYMNMLDSKFIFASDKYYDSVKKAASQIDGCKECIVPIDYSFRGKQNLSKLSEDFLNSVDKDSILLDSNTIEYDEFLKNGINYQGKIKEQVNGDDIAKILFTSGSTGPAKAIILTNKNIVAELMLLKNQTLMQFGKKGVCMKVVSDSYPYGNIVSKWFAIYVGKIAGLTPTLNSSNLYDYMSLYKCVYIQGVPQTYEDMKKDPRFKENGASYFKYGVCGGQKYSTSKKQETNKFLASIGSSAKVLDGSGPGESVACMTTAVGHKYNIDSVGKPLTGLNAMIIDENLYQTEGQVRELPYNEVGLIAVSGDTVMQGYFGNDEETQKSIVYYNNERWFVQDAIGYIDENGYEYIIGRNARCFITYDVDGAMCKVSPEQIEEILGSIPEIESCAVVYKINKINNSDVNSPKVYVKLMPNVVLDEKLKMKIFAVCQNSELPKCAIPTEIEEWVGEWPMTNTDKIDYKKIQTLSLTRDSNVRR